MYICIYIRCVYGIIGREITKHTVMYGVYIRFWPTLHLQVTKIQWHVHTLEHACVHTHACNARRRLCSGEREGHVVCHLLPVHPCGICSGLHHGCVGLARWARTDCIWCFWAAMSRACLVGQMARAVCVRCFWAATSQVYRVGQMGQNRLHMVLLGGNITGV